jgi:hypothetical protein
VSAYTDRELLVLDQVEDLLGAFADARLAPAGPVLARIRANVMAQAAAAAPTTSASVPRAIDTTRLRWQLFTSRVPRRAVALGMAAALSLGTSAAVLAAPPGCPFYNARLVIQTALLPAQVDDRLAAHERHLEERLAEAQAAAARGDTASLAAALAAFQEEVDAATADVGDDLDRLAHLEAMLAKHTAELTALAASVPDQSSIEHAIDASGKAIQKIKDKAQNQQARSTPRAPGGEPEGAGQGR